MPKHHKEHEQGAGLELIGDYDTLISLIIKNKNDKEWALNEVANEGPKHKQIYSALLLKRMHELVQSVEKQTGDTFTTQKGVTLVSHKDETKIPVPLVIKSLQKQDAEDVAEALSHSPAHELVAFNSLLQAIEWSIAALNKTSTT